MLYVEDFADAPLTVQQDLNLRPLDLQLGAADLLNRRTRIGGGCAPPRTSRGMLARIVKYLALIVNDVPADHALG